MADVRSVAALYDVHGNLPALEAALATADAEGAESIVVRADYDLGRAASLVRRTSYPQAEEFGPRHVLRPATEREALGLFERAPGG